METALAVANGALVVVTLLYVLLTRSMVSELKKARELSVRPMLGIDFYVVTSSYAWVQLSNTGQGPALNARLSLRYTSKDDSPDDVTKYDANMIAPEERHRFTTPRLPQGSQTMPMTTVMERYERITLEGTCEDALRNELQVRDEIDISQRWTMLMQSRHRLESDPLPALAEHARRISGYLQNLRFPGVIGVRLLEDQDNRES